MEPLHEPEASLTVELAGLIAEAEEKEAQAAALKKECRDLVFSISSIKDMRRIAFVLRIGFFVVGMTFGEYVISLFR